MTFWQGFKFVHRESWIFLFACPLLAAVPMVVEFVQHVVELQAGMYVDEAGAKVAESDPLRMQFGFLKVISILLPMYWVTRFLHGNRDARAARTFDRRAVFLFAFVMVYSIANTALNMFVFPATAGWMAATMGGGIVLSVLLARWQVAAPLGIFISPLRSARIILPHLLWGCAFSIAAMLPVMVLHYALAIVAVVAAPTWLDWALMALDSLVVGWLAAILTASGYVVALRAGPLEQRLTAHAPDPA